VIFIDPRLSFLGEVRAARSQRDAVVRALNPGPSSALNLCGRFVAPQDGENLQCVAQPKT